MVAPVNRPRRASGGVVRVAFHASPCPVLVSALAAVLEEYGIAMVDGESPEDADVLLVDLMLKGTVPEIVETLPGDVPVVFIGADEELRLRMLAHCTLPWAFLGSDATPESVAAAIMAVRVGLAVIAPPPLDFDSPPPARIVMTPKELAAQLSDRERDVLRLMVGGLPNKAIGQQLYISASTVRFHISGILGKFQVSNRTEAVSMAIREGLVTSD